jgi:DnaK suppressor protein
MRTATSRDTSKMDSCQIQRFRRFLEAHREEVLRSLNRLGDETRTVDFDYPQDAADMCITTLSKESLFLRTSRHRRQLQMIEAALVRMQAGTYSVCVSCGDDINPRRLEALPWTQYCLRCQERCEWEESQSSRGKEDHWLKKAG